MARVNKSRRDYYANRRKKLESIIPPDCPNCLFSEKISIADWFGSVAVWKCMECGKQFKHEPMIIDDDDE